MVLAPGKGLLEMLLNAELRQFMVSGQNKTKEDSIVYTVNSTLLTVPAHSEQLLNIQRSRRI
jgi:hypothetical protein